MRAFRVLNARTGSSSPARRWPADTSSEIVVWKKPSLDRAARRRGAAQMGRGRTPTTMRPIIARRLPTVERRALLRRPHGADAGAADLGAKRAAERGGRRGLLEAVPRI
jgi:hypothetical protein